MLNKPFVFLSSGSKMSNTLFMISLDNNMISSFSDAHKLEGGGFNIF